MRYSDNLAFLKLAAASVLVLCEDKRNELTGATGEAVRQAAATTYISARVARRAGKGFRFHDDTPFTRNRATTGRHEPSTFIDAQELVTEMLAGITAVFADCPELTDCPDLPLSSVKRNARKLLRALNEFNMERFNRVTTETHVLTESLQRRRNNDSLLWLIEKGREVE